MLSVATTDSYSVREGGESVWKDKASLWHDVFVFKPKAIKFAKLLKKGSGVDIIGALNYRPITNEKGFKRQEAMIVAYAVKALDRGHYLPRKVAQYLRKSGDMGNDSDTKAVA